MNTEIIIVIIVMIICLTSLVLFYISSLKKTAQWEKVLDPEISRDVTEKEKGKFFDLTKDKSGKKMIQGLLTKIGITREKFDSLALQSGTKMTYEEFTIKMIQNIVLAYIAFLFGTLYVHFFFALIFSAVILFKDFLNMKSRAKSRQKEFIKSFPFVLQLTSLSLSGGGQFQSSFREAVEKLDEGVCKDLLTEVVTNMHAYGGNIERAFNILHQKMPLQEVSEFIEAINNGERRGMPIRETLELQAALIEDGMVRRLEKSIASLENKLMLPVAMMLVAIVVLIFVPLTQK